MAPVIDGDLMFAYLKKQMDKKTVPFAKVRRSVVWKQAAGFNVKLAGEPLLLGKGKPELVTKMGGKRRRKKA